MKLPCKPRFEDQRLLTGGGHFVDDEAQAGRTYGVPVRSPHGFADIRALDTSHPTFPDAEATGKVRWGPRALKVRERFAGYDRAACSGLSYSDRPNTAIHPVKQSG